MSQPAPSGQPIATTVDLRTAYLQLLKDALLDRHYLENEVRLDYLLGLPPGSAPDVDSLRDPARTLSMRYRRRAEARAAGTAAGLGATSVAAYAEMGAVALDHLETALLDLERRGVPGDLVECGVGRGGGGIFLRGCLHAHEVPLRQLWVVDPFRASGGPVDPDEAPSIARLHADLNQVRDGYEHFRLLDDRVRFVQGEYDASLADAPVEQIALLRIGVEAALDLSSVLTHLLPRMAPGGTVILDGASRPAVEKRLAAYLDRSGVSIDLTRIDANTVTWRVAESAPPVRRAERSSLARRFSRARASTPHRVPLPAPAEPGLLDLSVVVVFYDMAREAPRTLQSLSRSYQRGLGDLRYEVIVVDNGSHPDQRLTAAEVASYGPEFTLVSPEEAPSSPTVALNEGIALARGDAVALMIDGAHVLTPGVFRHALAAMRTYEPAVVAVQQWYVGPGQQGDAQQAGYDQGVEDRLFRTIQWPTDGYRLFEIGHFIGDRDWFDGIIESNCLFAPRRLLEQVGGFDDSFDMAGGGYANLELFERLHAHPGVTPATVLGEGSFHQFHGGTTTNVSDAAKRRERVFSYGQHFRDLRGRGLLGLNKTVHYVGSMDTKAARRTRSRRQFLLGFIAGRDPIAANDAPPLPVPDELKDAATEALWQRQSWREATWLGHPVARFPTDLQSYQELVVQVRPATTVLIGDDVGLGGRALHLASVLDQLGTGRVVAIGQAADGHPRPAHDRITYLDGIAEDRAVVDEAAALVGQDGALVFIGLGGAREVVACFEAYAPLVPVGGYVVVENTVLNGRPVAPAHGPGPHEAAVELLGRHGEFVPDPAFERYTVTFNKNGYLKRTAAP